MKLIRKMSLLEYDVKKSMQHKLQECGSMSIEQKRKKQEEELRGSIILGDEVTTIGGIVGKVVNIKDDNITIETSIDKTLMEFKNWAIRDVKKLITDDEPESK